MAGGNMDQPSDIYDRHAVKLMQMGYHPVPVAPLGFETDKCPVRWDPHTKQFFKFKNWNTLPPVMDPQPWRQHRRAYGRCHCWPGL